MYTANAIRNICLLGHSGSGKTALAESLLYMTGAIDRMGKNADGNTVCDYDPEEVRRHVSISTSVVPLEYKNIKINLMDTPGGFDFSGAVVEALRAADAAILVLSAKDGITVGFEKAWKYCEDRNMPRFIYISKVDEDNSDYNATFNALREKYGNKVAPVVVPIWDAQKKIIGIIDVTYPKKETKEMRVLTKTEQKTLTNYLLQDLNPCKFGVLLALWTGMRIGEECAIQWKQNSFQEQSIKVEKTMLRLQNYNPGSLAKTMIVVDSPKTASSVRVIPMSKPVAALCQRMNVNNQQAYILTGSERYMEPRKLQYHFSRYLDSCNLKNVTFHTLRHTFATRCVEMDFEIKCLSEILGHASTAITLDRYVHCSMELKRENMHKLDTLILGNL